MTKLIVLSLLFSLINIVFAKSGIYSNSKEAAGIGDYDAAAALTLQECESGRYSSCASIETYFGGKFPVKLKVKPLRIQKIKELVKKGCDGRDATSCYVYAGYYFDNKTNVPIDTDKYLGFLDKSCEYGDQIACSKLGYIYKKGPENYFWVKRENSKGMNYFSKACELGNRDGCSMLMSAYENGFYEQTKDLEKAKYYASKECDIITKIVSKTNPGETVDCFNLNRINSKIDALK